MDMYIGIVIGLVIASVVDLIAYWQITRICNKRGIQPDEMWRLLLRGRL